MMRHDISRSGGMTETGREFKAVLESTAEVIEKQQEQIDELTEKIRKLEQ